MKILSTESIFGVNGCKIRDIAIFYIITVQFLIIYFDGSNIFREAFVNILGENGVFAVWENSVLEFLLKLLAVFQFIAIEVFSFNTTFAINGSDIVKRTLQETPRQAHHNRNNQYCAQTQTKNDEKSGLFVHAKYKISLYFSTLLEFLEDP